MSTPSAPTTSTTGSSAPQPAASGTPALPTQGGSVVTANSSTVVKPLVPATFDVPLLEDNGKNYDTWYVALQLVFKNRDIWPMVNGTEPHPDQTTDLAGHTEWGFKDREARLMMITALKKVRQKCIYCATSAKEY